MPLQAKQLVNAFLRGQHAVDGFEPQLRRRVLAVDDGARFPDSLPVACIGHRTYILSGFAEFQP